MDAVYEYLVPPPTDSSSVGKILATPLVHIYCSEKNPGIYIYDFQIQMFIRDRNISIDIPIYMMSTYIDTTLHFEYEKNLKQYAQNLVGHRGQTFLEGHFGA